MQTLFFKSIRLGFYDILSQNPSTNSEPVIYYTWVNYFNYFSLPIVSNRLINHLEVNYQLSHVSEADTANAIVVLSGMVRTIKTEESFDYEWGEAADQIFAGIDLFKENKASF